MRCLDRNVNLLMTERNSVQIDYCPECRGIWLERRKLDKLLEKTAPVESDRKYDEHRSRGDEDEQYGHGKRCGGWLGQLFD